MGGVRLAGSASTTSVQAGKRDLVALIMFRGNHYTSFVRKGRDWNKGWEWHEHAPSINWAAGRTRKAGRPSDGKGAMLPYLLVYDIRLSCLLIFVVLMLPGERTRRVL